MKNKLQCFSIGDKKVGEIVVKGFKVPYIQIRHNRNRYNRLSVVVDMCTTKDWHLDKNSMNVVIL